MSRIRSKAPEGIKIDAVRGEGWRPRDLILFRKYVNALDGGHVTEACPACRGTGVHNYNGDD